jgi:amino acid adenylation domain-containing protein
MELEDHIKGLPPDKQVQREKKPRQKLNKKNRLVAVPRDGIRETFPLSFDQQGLWFLYQLNPESPFYNIPTSLRLSGSLDVQALKLSINDIVKRHEALRTVFCSEGKETVQRVYADLTIDLPIEDLTQLEDKTQEVAIKQLSNGETRKFFNLGQLPLLRCKLLTLSVTEHILIINVHHIVFDGWSVSLLNKELKMFYAYHTAGEPTMLGDFPIQYGDFSVCQREWLHGEVLENQLQYWKERLAGAPPVLELPTDRPRPVVQSFNGGRDCMMFDRDTADAVKALSRQERSTLFMTLLAILQVLLYRYTHQQDIVVGFPISGRQQKETKGLIGLFVNTLALRTDLSGNPSFYEILRRVRENARDAYAYQGLPFEKIVEELKPERSLGYNPLVQVIFTLEGFSIEALHLDSFAIQPEEIDSGVEKFDLTVSAKETPEGLRFFWSYNSDIFNPDTIERMMRHFQRLLKQIVEHPDKPISDYELLAPEERQQLLFDWNATEANYPKEQCIQQLFEAQVARTPEAVAVVSQGQQLSYADLNTRANRLAHYLIEQGVGADTLVALCLERSLDLVVALLGILKAGGAYVPLDPGYPQERLAFMLEDTDAPVLITQSSLQAVLPPHTATVLCLDNAVDLLADYADANPAVDTQPQHLAYINYTSGSTGKPKGVCIPHQAVTRLVFGANYVTLDANKTLLHMAPISFDAATFELWGALLHGGRCVLYPDRIPTPEGLKTIIAEQGVDTLWLTAAFFNVVVDSDVGILSDVKQLLTGGEALSVSHIRKALQQLKTTQLVNGYGPTESTTFTCCYPIPRNLDDSQHAIPIGRPISNTQVYILDARLKPVPIGVVGELYIGGDGLARGYLNRPELTAECFIANPLTGTPGERLYKTGDRVRYLADGTIDFIGRTDDQVKIRGFRIELGEIEASLSRHPQVQDSLVMVREEAGDKRLAAYVVTEQAAENITAALRDYLKETLPEHMVPSAFVMLDAFPLTPNGKVDKKALAVMGLGDFAKTEIVAPRNITEQTLASIWCKLLRHENVSVLDNFFELGGHSLLAVRLLNNIEKTFGRKLPLAALFQAPTIDGLARILREDAPDFIWSRLMAIQPNGSRPPLFFVSGSTFKQIISRHLGADQPFFGFEDFGVDGERAAYITVEDLAAFYIKELRAFKANGPYMLAGFCFGGLVAFEMARELVNQGEQVLLLALIDSVNPDCAHSEEDTNAKQRAGRLNRFKNVVQKENPIYVIKSLLRKIKSRFVSYGSRVVLYRDNFLIYTKKTICNIFLYLNVPIPVSLRDFYIIENYVTANSLFHPQEYQGNIILLRSESLGAYDEQLGWGKVASDGVKVHFLKGNHLALIDDEENAALLARELNIEIEQALMKAGP